MKKTELYIDCFMGLSGDMLLASLFDLGVPLEIVKEEIIRLNLNEKITFNAKESSSYGFRGLKICSDLEAIDSPKRTWGEIRQLIVQSQLNPKLKNNVLKVFEAIANVESRIHGCSIENVHFHEVGALDSLLDIVGVCAAIEYLNPSSIICRYPPSGSGFVKTLHGNLPVPVPAVLELSKLFDIKLVNGSEYPAGELTTPTGLALMAILANNFGETNSFVVDSIGIGLGTNDFGRPNFLRTCLLNKDQKESNYNSSNSLYWQEINYQEAWIDDSTPEDLAELLLSLKNAGAIDVVSDSVHMKKGRQGFRVAAICKPCNSTKLHNVWFRKGTTIGIRERQEGRWLLPRKYGQLETPFGKLSAKAVKRLDDKMTIKIEHDELIRISLETGLSLDNVRNRIIFRADKFHSDQDWIF